MLFSHITHEYIRVRWFELCYFIMAQNTRILMNL